MNNIEYYPNVSDILYGSYITYDRLYQMTSYAFYNRLDNSDINIFIDVYSILKGIYTRGDRILVNDHNVIASCIINLGIHLRAYFETRHRTSTKIYLVYGGARPGNVLSVDPFYNNRNIQMENSNDITRQLIIDNLEIMKVLCPYLQDIFAIVDYNSEFNVIVSSIIDAEPDKPNVIYSKDQLSYQLVAFKPRTFMYRPKKRSHEDASWVVTKSTLFNAYRYGELSMKKKIDVDLPIKIFSLYQSLSGVKSRSIESFKNASTAIIFLSNAINNGVFGLGFNASSILRDIPSPIDELCRNTKIPPQELLKHFMCIDLDYQTMLFKISPNYIAIKSGIINLYNPQEVRNINDQYFQRYPLDLNRV